MGLNEAGIELEGRAKQLFRQPDAVSSQLGLTGQQPRLGGHVMLVRHVRQVNEGLIDVVTVTIAS